MGCIVASLRQGVITIQTGQQNKETHNTGTRPFSTFPKQRLTSRYFLLRYFMRNMVEVNYHFT